MTDQELMRLYQAGDHQAFLEIHRRYAGKVFGYIKKRCAQNVAEDVFQQVFIKFHLSRDRYQDQYPLSAWLFTITRSVLVDEYRKNAKHQGHLGLDLIAELADPVSEEKTEVSLEGLNKKERNLITDKFLNEKSYAEIAKQLGVSEPSARKRLSRAIEKLKALRKGVSHES